MTKQQLIAAIKNILDETPSGFLEKFTVAELSNYLELLYQTYPEERPK